MRRRFLVGAALLMSAAFSCSPSEPSGIVSPPPAAEPAPAQAAPEPLSSAKRDAQNFLVAAKKHVMSERGVASNVSSYESDVRKQLRVNSGTGLNEHIPRTPIDGAVVTPKMKELAAKAGVEVAELSIQPPAELTPVPRAHSGRAPFRYQREHLWRRHAARMVVRGSTDKSLKALYRLHVNSQMPLLVVESKTARGADIVLEGAFYDAPAVTPPVHELAPVTLETFAKRAGVAVPASGPEREAAEALLSTYTKTIRPKLVKAREALGRTHLAGSHFALYRKLTERISGDPFAERQ